MSLRGISYQVHQRDHLSLALGLQKLGRVQADRKQGLVKIDEKFTNTNISTKSTKISWLGKSRKDTPGVGAAPNKPPAGAGAVSLSITNYESIQLKFGQTLQKDISYLVCQTTRLSPVQELQTLEWMQAGQKQELAATSVK